MRRPTSIDHAYSCIPVTFVNQNKQTQHSAAPSGELSLILCTYSLNRGLARIILQRHKETADKLAVECYYVNSSPI